MTKIASLKKDNVKYTFKRDDYYNVTLHIKPLNDEAIVRIKDQYILRKKGGEKVTFSPISYVINGQNKKKYISIKNIIISRKADKKNITVKNIDYIENIDGYSSAKLNFVDNDIKIIRDLPNPKKTSNKANINMIFSGKSTSVSLYSLEKNFSVTIHSNKKSNISYSNLYSLYAEKGNINLAHNKISSNAIFKDLNLKMISTHIAGNMLFMGKQIKRSIVNSLNIEYSKIMGKFIANNCYLKAQNAIFFVDSVFSNVSGLLSNTALSKTSKLENNSRLTIKDLFKSKKTLINTMKIVSSNLSIFSSDISLNFDIILKNGAWVKTRKGITKAGRNETRVLTRIAD